METLTRFGYVTLRLRGNTVQLRWTFPKGRRREMSVGKYDGAGWDRAVRVARQIDRDIHSHQYDHSLRRYELMS